MGSNPLTGIAIGKKKKEVKKHEKLFISQPMRKKTNEEIYKERNVAYFATGWKEARSCIIEHDSAIAYGINSIVSVK